MKTIGMLGGMSWQSTALYYHKINEETKRILGGLHSAPIAMVSMRAATTKVLTSSAWFAAYSATARLPR